MTVASTCDRRSAPTRSARSTPDEAAAVRRHLRECAGVRGRARRAGAAARAAVAGRRRRGGGRRAARRRRSRSGCSTPIAREHAASRRAAAGRLAARLPRPRWLAVGARRRRGGRRRGRRRRRARRRRGARARATTSRSATSARHPARARAPTSRAATSGTTVHLWVEGPAARRGRRLRGAVRRRDWTATAGTFRTDADGRAYVVLTTALRQGEYDAIRIVRRGHRADGAPGQARRPRRPAVLNPRGAGRVYLRSCTDAD